MPFFEIDFDPPSKTYSIIKYYFEDFFRGGGLTLLKGVPFSKLFSASDEWDPKNRLFTPPPGAAPPSDNQNGDDYYNDDQYGFDRRIDDRDYDRQRDYYSPPRSNSRM